MWKTATLIVVILIEANRIEAQTTTVTLEQCYELAQQNYPLIGQHELLEKSKEFNIGNAHAGYLPQVTLYGQMTYQSEVTQVPISVPGFEVPTLSKDQYKIYGEVNQVIYDGGTIKGQTYVQKVSTQVEQQKIEVDLYKIRERINQIYFGALLAAQQLDQIELLKKDLQTNLSKTEAAIANGVAFRMNADILQAELLKADQRTTEVKALHSSYLLMLGYFINQTLDDNTELQMPSTSLNTDQEIVRPELDLFTYQSSLLEAQHQTLSSRTRPKVGLFVQGGYGKPALNLLKNEFDFYYIGGLRLNWSLSGFYNTNREKLQLETNQEMLDTQREVFLFNTNLTLQQQQQEIIKLETLIQKDNQIIELRTRIKNTAQAQLENGVISANDYLIELNAEDQVHQNLLLHRVQLVLAQYNYQNTIGN